MTTINFVPKQEVDKTQLLRVRRMVMMITTGLLAVYLIGCAGIVGWWWYKKTLERQTSSRIDAYLIEMRNYFDKEVLVRKLDARATAVMDFINNRGQASAAANILVQAKDVEVTGWKYEASGEQQIRVKAEGPGQLFVFARYLGDKYDAVQPDEVGWNVTEGWYGRFLVSKMKKLSL
jgi:hypothetical protein